MAGRAVESHSSLSTFENCPKQYHFRYVEKRKVVTESIEAFVGKRVHEVIERLNHFVASGRIPSLRRVLERYHLNWDARFDAARVRIVRAETKPALYRDAGARCLENFYRRNYPFDREETLGIEQKVEFGLDPEGRYRLRGVIDRVVRARDGALEIHDYKTGWRIPSRQRIDADRQLALYELGLRESRGERGPVRLVWHYLIANQLRISQRTPEQLEALREATCGVIDRIRSEAAWEPRPGPLCGWCEFADVCPARSGDEPPPPPPR